MLIIEKNIFCQKSISEVFEFFLQDESFKKFFDAEIFQIDIIKGGEIVIPFQHLGQKRTILGETTLILHNERFSFSWNEQQGRRERWDTPTMVNFYFYETEEGTRIEVKHTGFEYLPEEEQKSALELYRSYWESSGIMEKIRGKINSLPSLK